jgi:hypothetical protein
MVGVDECFVRQIRCMALASNVEAVVGVEYHFGLKLRWVQLKHVVTLEAHAVDEDEVFVH